MVQNKRSYSLEFKIKAMFLSNHRNELQLVADELGIPAKNLSRWKQKYRAGKLDATNQPITTKTTEPVKQIW